MPKITIDSKEIEFKQGQTIIEAARENGIEIPHFCWHPSLSVSGNCRVCLVEVEKMPKLVISCSTLAADGMVVHTRSPKTLTARKAVMEFILINHPLDCPICDEAGECKLQEYTNSHSIGESRFVEQKVSDVKRVEIGPRIMFDAERCIFCSRCIRFSDEIAKANQLTFTKRGDRVTLATFPGMSFDNPYSMNTVDICPVGALTNKDFRFKSRVWEMSATKSICTGCSRGCNTDIWVRNNKILRLTPRQNDKVNSYWMCDNGRINSFKNVNAEDRIDQVYVRDEGFLQPVTWEEGIKTAAASLKKYKPDEIAFIGSPYASNEDNYFLSKIAKALGIMRVSIIPHVKEGDCDDILICDDKTPNFKGAGLTGIRPNTNGFSLYQLVDGIKHKKIKAVFIIEDDLYSIGVEDERVFANLELLIVTATNRNKTTLSADILFPAASFAEKHGTYVNTDDIVQRIRPAVATEKMDRALDGMEMSRWDKFGTKFDRWNQGTKIDARPTWKILSGIGEQLGIKMKYEMAENVFTEIAEQIKEFSHIDYDSIGESGIKINTQKQVISV
jgi:NADH-quinone oxidoreductase subunit G